MRQGLCKHTGDAAVNYIVAHQNNVTMTTDFDIIIQKIDSLRQCFGGGTELELDIDEALTRSRNYLEEARSLAGNIPTETPAGPHTSVL